MLLAVLDGDQDVRRLDVSVDESAAVCGVERRRELLEQIDGPAWLERPLLEQNLAQVGAGDVVHHEEQHSFVLAGVMDADDVGVVQRGGDPHLALESLAELLVLGQLGGEHLQRVDPVQRDVSRAVHDAHAAAADQLIDAVAPDYRAGPQLIASHRHSYDSPSSSRPSIVTFYLSAPTTP